MSSKKENFKVTENVSSKDKFVRGIIKGINAPVTFFSSIPKMAHRRESIIKKYPDSQSVKMPNENKHIWRRSGFENELIESYDGVHTIQELISKANERFSEFPCHGTRRVIKEVKETDDNGREWTKLCLGNFEWESYSEIYGKVQKIARMLSFLNITSEHKLAIFADTSSEWICFFGALSFLNIQAVTVYSTLDDDAIVYALNLTEVVGIYVDDKSCHRIYKLMEKIPTIKHIILSSSCTKESYTNLPENIKKPKVEVIERVSVKLSEIIKKQRNSFSQTPSKSLKKAVMFKSVDLDDKISVDSHENSDDNIVINLEIDGGKALMKQESCKKEEENINTEKASNKNEETNDEISKKPEDEKKSTESPRKERDSFTKLQEAKSQDNIQKKKDSETNINSSKEFKTEPRISALNNYNLGDQAIMCHHMSFFLRYGGALIKKSPLKPVTVDKSDVAVIMFTSGSTGTPKGVVILHRNIIATLSGGCFIKELWEAPILYSAFLPLAHIYELMMELAIFLRGGAIGYCKTLTLTDRSPMVAKGSKGDLTVLKPNACAFVPLVMERIKKAIIDSALKKSSTAASILEYGLNHKKNKRYSGIVRTPVLDKLVFRKLKALIGGNLRWATCGGALLSSQTEEFINVSFGVPVKQGYGLTETCSAGFMGRLNDLSVGNCGPPFPTVEIQLVPWEEGGYLPTDEPNPRGEIWIHGNSVAQGYYKLESLTEQDFYKDPSDDKIWFKTGDIGEYLPNGSFRIIDRKKDITKLNHGEYLSLVQIESRLIQSQFVEMLCAAPNSQSEHIVLLISPNMNMIKEEATRRNIEIKEDESTDDIIKKPEVTKFVTENILELCKREKFNKFEVPKFIHIVSEPWTPESGFLTPSMKVKRVSIKEFYKHFLV